MRRASAIILAATAASACGGEPADTLPGAADTGNRTETTRSSSGRDDALMRQASDLAERLEHGLDRGELSRRPLGTRPFPARLSGSDLECLVATERDLAARRRSYPDTVSATGPWIAACRYTGADAGRASYDRDVIEATALLAG